MKKFFILWAALQLTLTVQAREVAPLEASPVYPVVESATGYRDKSTLWWQTPNCQPTGGQLWCDLTHLSHHTATPVIGCRVTQRYGNDNIRWQADAPTVAGSRLVYLGYDAFETNRSTVKEAEQRHLVAWARRWQQQSMPEGILVVATADARGLMQYNQDLALKRARAVRQFLSNLGIDPAFIAIQGIAFSRWRDYSLYPPGHARFRRIELYRHPTPCLHSATIGGAS